MASGWLKMVSGWLKKGLGWLTPQSPEVASAEAAIQKEVAAIEGREMPPPTPPSPGEVAEVIEVPAVEQQVGKLEEAIRVVMDAPAGPPEGGHRPPPGGTSVPNRSPPGGGVGMVDNGATSPLFALCLSGGGIRSAAFCLGAVQALAHAGLLARFHYLSTVSGGGYTGSLIARLINTMGGVAPAERVLADPRRAPTVAWLYTLRDYTSYLAPRFSATSLDVWAAIALYLRNTLANWVLFLPGLIALALLPRLYLRLIDGSPEAVPADGAWFPAIFACIFLVVAASSACVLVPGHQFGATRPLVNGKRVALQITAPLLLGWALLATIWFAARGLQASPWLIPGISAAMSIVAYLVAWGYAVFPGTVAVPALFRYNIVPWIIATFFDNLVLWAGINLAQTFRPDPAVLAILGPAWIVLSHSVHAACFAVLRREASSSWMDREWIARSSASEMLPIMLWMALATTCLVLPHWLHGMLQNYSTTAAVPAILTGPLAAWLGRSTLTVAASAVPKASVLRLMPNLLALVASVVFLITLLMAASAVGWRIAAHHDCSGPWTWAYFTDPWTWANFKCPGCMPSFWLLLPEAAMLAALSWILGQWVININRFSLHELYRNRLVRAFLGSARPTLARQADGFAHFDEFDSIRLSDALPYFPTAAAPNGLRLFPVVNTALNLVSGTRTAWAERKAASFTMTPLHCGSAVLRDDGAYVATSSFGGSPLAFPPQTLNPGIQLGTAMTISGAAVSPNAGYLSSPTTSFIMTLFNARLGAWLPNPATATTQTIQRSRPPNGFLALVREMLGQTNDTSPAIYLSDGGHFDNLGLYEMLRRRCRLIVAFDAGCDPQYAYSDLGDALRKARIDLGVEVIFQPTLGPITGAAPAGPFLRADIHYPSGPGVAASSGVLLYIKSHLPASAPADVFAHKATNTDFPHDTTGNQFFTESQFESYRRLGEYLAS